MKNKGLHFLFLFISIAIVNSGVAQSADTAGLNVLLYQTLLPVNKKPTRIVTDYFEKNAEVVDASGILVYGRNAIVNWFKLQKEACPGYQADTFKRLWKHTRYLDPALRVKIIHSTVKVNGQDIFATCTYFSRRIEGKWYVEACTVVQAQGPPK